MPSIAHQEPCDGPPRLALALSGGGHRATLFTLGALLAIVDRRLNARVEQMSSVSGGSITNAFVAQRCDFQQIGPRDLDAIAKELVGIVVESGVVTASRVTLFLALTAGSAAVAAITARRVAEWSLGSVTAMAPWIAFGVGLVAFAAALMSFGHLVEWLLDRSYFRHSKFPLAGPVGDRAVTLRSLPDRSVEHVFCATDLVAGKPVYISTWHGGLLWRRTFANLKRGLLLTSGQSWDAGKLRLAEVVRASAAFPGIPPRRLVFFPWLLAKGGGGRLRRIRDTAGCRSYFGKPMTADLRARLDREELQRDLLHPKVAFLGDGGLWNNLGTHVLREDRLLHGERAAPPTEMLCINASAPLTRSRPLPYHVPVVAVLTWLVRCLNILNANTVVPRANAMAAAVAAHARAPAARTTADPLDVVVDLRSVAESVFELRLLARHRHDIADAHPSVIGWERDLAAKCLKWADSLLCGRYADPEELANLVGEHVRTQPAAPWHSPGLVNYDDVDTFEHSAVWHKLETWSEGDVNAPTTLGRLDGALALRLVARGYLNTYVMSWLIKPPKEPGEEVAALADLPARLAALLPVPGP